MSDNSSGVGKCTFKSNRLNRWYRDWILIPLLRVSYLENILLKSVNDGQNRTP